jgi:hypothetical protein
MNYEQELVEKARICLWCTSWQTRRACSSSVSIPTIRAAKLRHSIKSFCCEPVEHLLSDRMCHPVLPHPAPVRRLALCDPNCLHLRHQVEVLDTRESGRHVRISLDPIGFRIEGGIGGPAVYPADRFLRAIPNEFEDQAALPLLPIVLPTVCLAMLDPRIPFFPYPIAIKPGDVL